MLSEKNIQHLQNIYKKEFGLKLSREEAFIEGHKIIHLMRIIYKPMTKADFQRIQRRFKELENPRRINNISGNSKMDS